MRILIYNELEELHKHLADFIIKMGKQAIAEQDYFNLALSGGNTPKALYKLLAEQYKEALDWNKVYFFLVDERYVPHKDAASNGKMLEDYLLKPLAIAKTHYFLYDTGLEPEACAEAYTKLLKQHFKQGALQFDLILLGMGEDAHFASVFPHSPLLSSPAAAVDSVFVAHLDMYRLSFSPALINQAKATAFFVVGRNKAIALKHVLEDKKTQIQKFPAQAVKPQEGSLTWFIDAAAAINLK